MTLFPGKWFVLSGGVCRVSPGHAGVVCIRLLLSFEFSSKNGIIVEQLVLRYQPRKHRAGCEAHVEDAGI